MLRKYEEVLNLCDTALKIENNYTEAYVLKGFAYIK